MLENVANLGLKGEKESHSTSKRVGVVTDGDSSMKPADLGPDGRDGSGSISSNKRSYVSGGRTAKRGKSCTVT